MSRRPIVGGNWKTNPEKVADLESKIANINACDTTNCDVYVCPSPLHMGLVYDKFTKGAKVTPQNCNFKGCGAYTGEMAADQFASMGIEWCLIGHSERRGEFGLPTPAESSDLLATKLAYLLEKGIKCVLAIGEPLPVREKGIEAVLAFCIEQLKPCLPHLDAAKVVIAYEPVWSIGTGVTATPAQAQETHKAIRDWIAKEKSAECAAAIRIQYGGSANAKNAPELSACPDIDGFLVGGASLKPEFAEIVAAIAKAKMPLSAQFEAVYKKSGLVPHPTIKGALATPATVLTRRFDEQYKKSGLVAHPTIKGAFVVSDAAWRDASPAGSAMAAVRASRPGSAKPEKA